MGDDATLPAPGERVALDELSTLNGVGQSDPKPKAQRVKVVWGTDGVAVDVSAANPLPVTDPNVVAAVDGVEALLTSIDGHVDGLEGFLDGVEGLLGPVATDAVVQAVRDRIGALTTPAAGSVNAQLAAILSSVDGLEGFLDGVEGLLAPVATDTQLQAVRDRLGALTTPAAGSTNRLLTDLLAQLDPTPVSVLDDTTTLSWANSAAAATAKTVDTSAFPASLRVGKTMLVIVRNPSTESALTLTVKTVYSQAGTKRADVSNPGTVSTINVNAANGEGQRFLVDMPALPGGVVRLSFTNNTVIGGAGAFIAGVQAWAV